MTKNLLKAIEFLFILLFYYFIEVQHAHAQSLRELLTRILHRPITYEIYEDPPYIPYTEHKKKSHRAKNSSKILHSQAQSAALAKSPSTPVQNTDPSKPIAKNPKARRILVVGDFCARAIALGLKARYRDNPNAIIIAHTHITSGFVKPQTYDWNKTIESLLEKEKPSVVVIALGSNDNQMLQPMAGELYTANNPSMLTTPLAPKSAAFDSVYQARICRFLKKICKANLPFFFLGAPPFPSLSLNRSLRHFNTIYQKCTQTSGGIFIDIWPLFSDNGQRMVFFYKNNEGKTLRIRPADGLDFTPEGCKLLTSALYQKLTLLVPAKEENVDVRVPAAARHFSRVKLSLLNAKGENMTLINAQQKLFIPESIKTPYRGRVDDFLLDETQPSAQRPGRAPEAKPYFPSVRGLTPLKK